MTLPGGSKRTVGLLIVLAPFIAGLFGYDVSEAFPVEAARFSEEILAVVGTALVIVGEIMAKGPAWFVPKPKKK